MSKHLSIKETRGLLNQYNKENLVFIGDEKIKDGCEFLNLPNEKMVELQMRWYSYVDEYLRTNKISSEMRNFIQFFQIFVKIN